MVRLESVTVEGFFADMNMDIPSGNVCCFVMETDLGKDVLLDVLAGLRRPDSGRLVILGDDIYALSTDDTIAAYRNVGVVWRGGGLVSNLRVWENIALPAEYHLGERAVDLEEKVRDILEKAGKTGSGLGSRMSELPAHLPEHERTLAGMVRAMLMEPHLVIYDSIFEGMGAGTSRALAQLANEFHGKMAGRTSVFVTFDEASLKQINIDIVFRQQGEHFIQG